MLKQVIVMRKDLNMRKGKLVAQGAHASMKVVLLNLHNELVVEWLDSAFTKIVLSVGSEEELLQVLYNAWAAGIMATDIIDNGKTEFNGVKTRTCIAIGPDKAENIDAITGSLKLL